MNKTSKKFFSQPILIILALMSLVYLPTLFHEPVWDDPEFIFNWGTVNTISLDSVKSIIAGDTPSGHEGVYRPVRGLIYLLAKALWHENFLCFRLLSVTAHLIVTYLIFRVISQFKHEKYTPELAALLFGLHPLVTEMVSFTTASLDLWGVIFALISAYFFIINLQNKNQRLSSLPLVFAALAFFSYEITLVLPAVFIVLGKAIRPKFKVKKLAPFVYLWVFYWVIRLGVFGIVPRTSDLRLDLFSKVLLSPLLVIKYFGLMLFPHKLNVVHEILPNLNSSWYYDWPNSQPINQLIQSYWPLSVLALAVITAIGFSLYKYRRDMFWVLALSLLSLLPVLPFVTLPNLFADRYAYIATMFFSIALAQLIIKASKCINIGSNKIDSPNLKVKVLLLAMPVVLTYGYLTFTRNVDWSDSHKLWTSCLSLVESSLCANNLGQAYANTGNTTLAGEYYQKAYQLNQDHLLYRLNLVANWSQIGQRDRALELIEETISLYPESELARYYQQLILDSTPLPK